MVKRGPWLRPQASACRYLLDSVKRERVVPKGFLGEVDPEHVLDQIDVGWHEWPLGACRRNVGAKYERIRILLCNLFQRLGYIQHHTPKASRLHLAARSDKIE